MTSLLRERIEPGIEVLRLNRPERRNALDTPTLDALVAALAELERDADLRVLILSSTSERAFCAGADVEERLDAAGGVARMEAFARLYIALEAFPAPTVCVCVGNCVGAGAELVAGCDLRVAGENLKLAWAGSRLGVPVGPARLAPLVGASRARELVLTGRTVQIEEAVELGLIARRAPEGGAEAAALELARELSAHPPAGLRRLKSIFRELDGSAERVALESRILVDWQREGPGLPARPPA